MIHGGHPVLRQLISRLKKKNYTRKLYFENARDEIAELNLNLLKILSVFLTIMILILIIIAKAIVVGWKPTLQHILFAPSLSLFTLISYLYDKHKNISINVVNLLCILFCTVVMLFVIYIDVIPYRYSPSSFMQVVLIVLPVLFIFRFRVIYTFTIFFEIVYVISLFFYKSPKMYQNDLFNSIVGMFVFFILTWITMSLRVESYNVKNKYCQLSKFDNLTGVMNKSTCENEIRDYLSRQNNNQRCSLFIIDIDNYKLVNDRLGHQMGDDVLCKMGQVLIHSFDTTDIIGRIGGDEFIVMIDNVTDKNILKKKCDLLYSKAKDMSDSINFNINYSIGVAIQKDSDITYEEMFKSADDALYEAKSFGKGQCVMHKVTKKKVLDIEKKTMLISYNNLGVRRYLADKFINDFEMIEARCILETLSKLSMYEENIDIVILDMDLPKLDSYKLLEYMKSRDNLLNIPIIAIESDEVNGKKAITIGAADVLYKPIDDDLVKIKVMNVIENKSKRTVGC